MLKNIIIFDAFVAIAATAFIAVKAGEFRRALKLGREEKLPGTIRSVIRCLVGRGRTFNKNDGGLWYMVVLAIGGAYIMVELAFSSMEVQPPILAKCSLLVSILVLAGSLWFIVSSVIKKVREGCWMDMLPILALPLLALNRIYHYTFTGGIFEQHLLYYFAVLFAAGAFPHGLSSMVNIYYKNRGPMGKTRPFSLSTDPTGAATVEDLSWKSILDGQACANCGRCQTKFVYFLPLARSIIIKAFSHAPEMQKNDIFEQMAAIGGDTGSYGSYHCMINAVHLFSVYILYCNRLAENFYRKQEIYIFEPVNAMSHKTFTDFVAQRLQI